MASSGARLFVVLGIAHLTFAATRLGAGLGIGLAGGDAAAVMGGVAGATAVTLVLTLLPLRGPLACGAARSGRAGSPRSRTRPRRPA